MLKIKEIENKEIWENFIKSYSPQSFFQSWEWGEAIRKIKNQKSKIKNIYRLGLYENDKLVGIAQVVKVTAKRGTFLHVRHGPVLSKWNKTYFAFLLNFLKDLGKENRAAFIRVSPQLPNNEGNRFFLKGYKFIDAPIHRMDGEVCWVLDLDKTEEELLLGMRKTTRYLIRQAEKLGVVVEKSSKVLDMAEFLELYDKTAERHHFVKHSGIKEEFEEFRHTDKITLFKGSHDHKLLSAALIIFYNTQAIYHHSASIEQKIPVNYLLQWEAIKEAKKRGKKLYNMWGIAPDDNLRHPWQGLTLFKKGFGGRQIEYLHAQDYPLSVKYCATYIIEILRKIWKGY